MKCNKKEIWIPSCDDYIPKKNKYSEETKDEIKKALDPVVLIKTHSKVGVIKLIESWSNKNDNL